MNPPSTIASDTLVEAIARAVAERLAATKWNWSDRKYDFDIVEWEEVE